MDKLEKNMRVANKLAKKVLNKHKHTLYAIIYLSTTTDNKVIRLSCNAMMKYLVYTTQKELRAYPSIMVQTINLIVKSYVEYNNSLDQS